MRYIITLALLLSTAAILSACNTVDGVGKDLRSGGQHLSNAAEGN